VNALVLLVLLMSRLQIFNAHPALYLGAKSDFEHTVLAMEAVDDENGLRGVTQVFSTTFDTTGVLGARRGPDGELEERGFPPWITRPGYQDLSTGRRWHVFFAWLFLLKGLFTSPGLGERACDLAPTGAEIKNIGHSVAEHIRFGVSGGRGGQRWNQA
jgi:thiosulfate reductase cytochrome b subunit